MGYNIDFSSELTAMRAKFARKRPSVLDLPRPSWLGDRDALSKLYVDRYSLLPYGNIYYGRIIQANPHLFDRRKKTDHPAFMLYSTDPAFEADTQGLRKIARQLAGYKSMNTADIPEEFREIARVIKDEYDRKSFRFDYTMPDGRSVRMYAVSMMVFRCHLPSRIIESSLFPVLAAPDMCDSVLILPKRYWTRRFAKAWKKGVPGVEKWKFV